MPDSSIDDDLSTENAAMVKWMQRIIHKAAVKSLLAGNDACCFTTEQFQDQYQKEMDQVFKCSLPSGIDLWQWRPGTARRWLQELGIVWEVDSDLWALKHA